MIKYMLDTNICIYIIKKRPETVFQLFQRMVPGEICISAVTLGELEYGVAKSQYKERNKLALIYFMTPLSILPFSEAAAAAFGEIRAKLESSGSVIGAYDMMIAAHAKAEHLILVTNNAREFERVEGLTVENWI